MANFELWAAVQQSWASASFSAQPFGAIGYAGTGNSFSSPFALPGGTFSAPWGYPAPTGDYTGTASRWQGSFAPGAAAVPSVYAGSLTQSPGGDPWRAMQSAGAVSTAPSLAGRYSAGPDLSGATNPEGLANARASATGQPPVGPWHGTRRSAAQSSPADNPPRTGAMPTTGEVATRAESVVSAGLSGAQAQSGLANARASATGQPPVGPWHGARYRAALGDPTAGNPSRTGAVPPPSEVATPAGGVAGTGLSGTAGRNDFAGASAPTGIDRSGHREAGSAGRGSLTVESTLPRVSRSQENPGFPGGVPGSPGSSTSSEWRGPISRRPGLDGDHVEAVGDRSETGSTKTQWRGTRQLRSSLPPASPSPDVPSGVRPRSGLPAGSVGVSEGSVRVSESIAQAPLGQDALAGDGLGSRRSSGSVAADRHAAPSDSSWRAAPGVPDPGSRAPSPARSAIGEWVDGTLSSAGSPTVANIRAATSWETGGQSERGGSTPRSVGGSFDSAGSRPVAGSPTPSDYGSISTPREGNASNAKSRTADSEPPRTRLPSSDRLSSRGMEEGGGMGSRSRSASPSTEGSRSSSPAPVVIQHQNVSVSETPPRSETAPRKGRPARLDVRQPVAVAPRSRSR